MTKPSSITPILVRIVSTTFENTVHLGRYVLDHPLQRVIHSGKYILYRKNWVSRRVSRIYTIENPLFVCLIVFSPQVATRVLFFDFCTFSIHTFHFFFLDFFSSIRKRALRFLHALRCSFLFPNLVGRRTRGL